MKKLGLGILMTALVCTSLPVTAITATSPVCAATGEVAELTTGDAIYTATDEAVGVTTGDAITTVTKEAVQPPVIKQYPVGDKAVSKEFYIGDADFDGLVELEDAQAILKMALKIQSPTEKEVFYVIGSLDYYSESNAVSEQSGDITLEDAQIALKRALKISKDVTVTRSDKNLYFEALYKDELETWEDSMSCCVLETKEKALWFAGKLGIPQLKEAIEKLSEEDFEGQALLFEPTRCSYSDDFDMTADSAFIQNFENYEEYDLTHNEAFLITSYNRCNAMTYGETDTYLYQFSFINTGTQNIPKTGLCYSNYENENIYDYTVSSSVSEELVEEGRITDVSNEEEFQEYVQTFSGEMRDAIMNWRMDFDNYTYIFLEKNDVRHHFNQLDVTVSGNAVELVVNEIYYDMSDYYYDEEDKAYYETVLGHIYRVKIRKAAIEDKDVQVSINKIMDKVSDIDWDGEDEVEVYVDEIKAHNMGDAIVDTYKPVKVGDYQYQVPLRFNDFYGQIFVEWHRKVTTREALEVPPEITIDCEGVDIENYGLTIHDWAGLDVSDVKQSPDFFKTQCPKGEENPLFYVKSWEESRVGAIQLQFPYGMEPDFIEVEDRVLSEDGSIRYKGDRAEVIYRSAYINDWFSVADFSLAEHYSIETNEPYKEYKPMNQLVHPYYRGYNVNCYWQTDAGLQSCTYHIVLRTQTTRFENAN